MYVAINSLATNSHFHITNMNSLAQRRIKTLQNAGVMLSLCLVLFYLGICSGGPILRSRNHIKNDCRVFHLDQQHFNHGCCVSQGWKSLHFSFIKKQHSSYADGQTGGGEKKSTHLCSASFITVMICSLKKMVFFVM